MNRSLKIKCNIKYNHQSRFKDMNQKRDFPNYENRLLTKQILTNCQDPYNCFFISSDAHPPQMKNTLFFYWNSNDKCIDHYLQYPFGCLHAIITTWTWTRHPVIVSLQFTFWVILSLYFNCSVVSAGTQLVQTLFCNCVAGTVRLVITLHRSLSFLTHIERLLLKRTF